jgi:hypothetical protein
VPDLGARRRAAGVQTGRKRPRAGPQDAGSALVGPAASQRHLDSAWAAGGSWRGSARRKRRGVGARRVGGLGAASRHGSGLARPRVRSMKIGGRRRSDTGEGHSSECARRPSWRPGAARERVDRASRDPAAWVSAQGRRVEAPTGECGWPRGSRSVPGAPRLSAIALRWLSGPGLKSCAQGQLATPTLLLLVPGDTGRVSARTARCWRGPRA